MDWLGGKQGLNWLGGRAPRGSSGGGPGPQPGPLAPYYGVGPGKIAIHYSTEGAVVDGSGGVTALSNLGGAGAYFDAAVVGSPAPAVDGEFLVTTIGGGYPSLNNAADLLGVRFMFVLKPSDLTNPFGDGAGIVSSGVMETIIAVISADPWILQAESGEGTFRAFQLLTSDELSIFELEVTETSISAWQNGASLGSSAAVFTSFPVSYLGGFDVGDGPQVAGGPFGDMLGVTLGAGADDAIAAARAYLADRFGVAL